MNEMKKFAERKYLSQKNLVHYHEDGSWPFLHIEDPTVLARFFALLKQKAIKKNKSGWVFCRGQSSHHKLMLPSLFRGENEKYPVSILLVAQEHLMNEIKSNFSVKRFQNENLPALLQHYGLKTSWLDLVDNLFIAIWFATNSINSGDKKGPITVEGSTETYGWIYFISNSAKSEADLISIDLRTGHHSLSVRPHAQHGISATRDSSIWRDNNKDLKKYVVATVRFEVSEKWYLSGYMASPEYLFPSSKLDNTLKNLQQTKLLKIISETEKKYCLSDGSLGYANWVN
jgi:hypothetical protein